MTRIERLQVDAKIAEEWATSCADRGRDAARRISAVTSRTAPEEAHQLRVDLETANFITSLAVAELRVARAALASVQGSEAQAP